MKKILFTDALILLVLQTFRQITGIYEINRLNGAFVDYWLPKFTLGKWNHPGFHANAHTLYNNSFGLRSQNIRITNQKIDYSLFNKVQDRLVIPLKEVCLFENMNNQKLESRGKPLTQIPLKSSGVFNPPTLLCRDCSTIVFRFASGYRKPSLTNKISVEEMIKHEAKWLIDSKKIN